jgi:hypothetical protein
MERIIEIQAIAFAGFAAGMVLWPKAVEWLVVVLTVSKAEPRDVRSALAAVLLHSGLWTLLLIGWCTYHLLTAYSDARVSWFLGSFYVCLALFGALAVHLSRTVGSQGSKSPILWFAKAMRQRRNFFLFSYVTAAAIGLPYLIASDELRGLILFVLPLSALGVHFMAWYMWQFVGPYYAQLDKSKDPQ